MGQKIRIAAAGVVAVAELGDSDTARAILEALPIRGTVRRWGEEIYFGIDLEQASAADAREVMEVGELAYWPPGRAFCIFFGPTPASIGDEPRAASEVNPVGSVEGDATRFTSVPDGAEIVLERLEGSR